MKTNPNDFATASGYKDANSPAWIIDGGLTKREYFAALAMQGFCANPAGIPADSRAEGADLAVKMADVLIDALNKEKV